MSGRWLSESDVDSAQRVAVINQTMAAHLFDGENPLGRQIQVKAFDEQSSPPRDAYFQVIGVLPTSKTSVPKFRFFRWRSFHTRYTEGVSFI